MLLWPFLFNVIVPLELIIWPSEPVHAQNTHIIADTMASTHVPALPLVVGRVPVSVGGYPTFTDNTAASSGIEDEDMSAFTGGGELTFDDPEIDIPPLCPVNAKELCGVTDFASTIGDVSLLNAGVEGTKAIRGLLCQVTQMSSKMVQLTARVDILSKQYSTKTGFGKNTIKKVKDMAPVDERNVGKMNAIIDEFVAPNEMILYYGWDIYSEKETSFCFIFLDKANLELPEAYKNIPTLWMGFVAPWINYAMSRKRNNLTQSCRKHWISEYLPA